jgi:2'-5' RNA ligase
VDRVRLYAAIVPPPEEIEQLFRHVGSEHDHCLTWNPRDSVRIGLCNYGSLTQLDVDNLSDRLRTGLAEIAPFAIWFAGGDALEHEGDDSVTVKVKGALEELRALALMMADSARREGLLVDRRWYEPQAQIARVNSATTVPSLQNVVDRLADYRGTPWTVFEVSLIETRVTPEPVASQKFDVIDTLPLKCQPSS